MKNKYAHWLVFLAMAGLAQISGAETTSTVSLSQFTPPASDTSVEFLREVFGNLIGLIVTGGNVEGGDTTSDALGAMMFIFNGAVLFLGMLFVGYTTVKGIVDSAHDGEMLGKKMSSIWIPLRSAAGAAVIIPFGSGYNLVQIAVMWLALQGVGIADQMWTAAVDTIGSSGMVSRPMLPNSRPLAAAILKSEVCMAAKNKDFEARGDSNRITLVTDSKRMSNTGEIGQIDGLSVAVPVYGAAKAVSNLANSFYTVNTYRWAGTGDSYKPQECGAITWKQSWESSSGNSNTKVIKAPIMAAHNTAVKAMIEEVRPIAQQIVNGEKPTPGGLDVAANNYENALRAAAKAAVSQTNDKAREDFLVDAKAGGWLYAGTWYNHIIKLNDVMQSTLNALPTAESAIATEEQKYLDTYYKDAMAVAEEYAKHRQASVRNRYYNDTDILTTSGSNHTDANGLIKKIISAPFMGAINQLTQEIAGSNLNHMSQMKSFGDIIVVTGETLLLAMTTATGFANSWISQASAKIAFDIHAALAFLGGIMTFMTLALFAFGVTLSTYVPMIPFITWMTSVVNWFVLVFESVVASPLFAVAHVHPDGDEAVGKAGPGYMMILSLVMRPALMLFGLIGAMLLTQPITGYINTAFMTVVAGVQADSMTGVVSFFAFVAIYVILMTTVVHIVFSLIHWIPDNVLRWLGNAVGGIHGAESTGDKGHNVFVGGVAEAKHGMASGMNPHKAQGEKPGAENSSEQAKNAAGNVTNNELTQQNYSD